MAPQLIVEMTADEAKVFSSQQRVIRQQEQMIAKYKELARSGAGQTRAAERAGRANEQAFGPEKRSGVEAFGRALGGVVGIAMSLAPAFAASAAELSRNFEILRGGESGLAQLAQLARTPEEFRALQSEARGMFAAGGAPDLDTAARRLFGLVSAELDRTDRQFLTRLGAAGFVGDTGDLATSINTLQTTLGEAAGNARDLVNAGIAASAVAPATVPELLAGTARSAATGARIGFRPEELLAATTIASKATGSAELGGTQVASLMRSIGENIDQFQGMSLAEVIQDIQGRNLSQEQLSELLGRAEAINAFSALATNIDTLRQLQQDILLAQRDNVVARRVGFIEQDPRLAAQREARSAEAATVLSDESRATRRALFRARVEEAIARRRREGVPELALGAARGGAAIAEFLGAERLVTRAAGLISGPETQRGIEAEQQMIERVRRESLRDADQTELQRQQLDVQRRQLDALLDLNRPNLSPVAQPGNARGEQAQQQEIGK